MDSRSAGTRCQAKGSGDLGRPLEETTGETLEGVLELRQRMTRMRENVEKAVGRAEALTSPPPRSHSRESGNLIGVTGNLLGRVITHREELIPGFTSRYHIHSLVYAEFHSEPGAAIWREKQMKKWRRAWKIELIEKYNPDWRDLYDDIAVQ